MLWPGVDLQLRDLPPRQAVLRKHALDRHPENFLRPARHLLAQRSRADAARIAGVPVVALLVELVARDLDALGVHDDDEVAGVDMRRVLGLALAAQRVGDPRREAAESLALGVDEVPVASDLARFGGIRLHHGKGGARRPRRRRMLAARPGIRPPRHGTDGGRTEPRSSARRAVRRPRSGGPGPAPPGTAGKPPPRPGWAGGSRSVPGWVGTTFQQRA